MHTCTKAVQVYIIFSLFRTEQNQLKDIKFDYVCGSGRLLHTQLYSQIGITIKRGSTMGFILPLRFVKFKGVKLSRNLPPNNCLDIHVRPPPPPKNLVFIPAMIVLHHSTMSRTLSADITIFYSIKCRLSRCYLQGFS